MSNLPDSASPWRQRFKWTVYAILFLDFIVYLVQDFQYAHYTLDSDSGLLEVLAAYVTSIDLVAWFTLVLLFELETYVLTDRDWRGTTKRVVQGVRIACYVAILHTSFAYDIALHEFRNPDRLPPTADVCAYAGSWSFLRNRDYLDIDEGNCRTIGQGPEFFALSDDAVLTDRDGLREGTILAWTDLIESVAWLLIVFSTEAILRFAHQAAGGATLVLLLERAKLLFYAVIVGIAAYWGSKGQLLYFWDELVWVLGFLVIDWNIRDWQTFKRALSVSPSPA